MLSCSLNLSSGKSTCGTLSSGTGQVSKACPVARQPTTRHGMDSLLSCTTRRVTLTAVSVVICLGPSLRPSNPFLLSSEVRSGHVSTPTGRLRPGYYIPLGGSSPASRGQSTSLTLAEASHTQDATEQEGVKGVAVLWRQVLGRGRVQEADSRLVGGVELLDAALLGGKGRVAG